MEAWGRAVGRRPHLSILSNPSVTLGSGESPAQISNYVCACAYVCVEVMQTRVGGALPVGILPTRLPSGSASCVSCSAHLHGFSDLRNHLSQGRRSSSGPGKVQRPLIPEPFVTRDPCLLGRLGGRLRVGEFIGTKGIPTTLHRSGVGVGD